MKKRHKAVEPDTNKLCFTFLMNPTQNDLLIGRYYGGNHFIITKQGDNEEIDFIDDPWAYFFETAHIGNIITRFIHMEPEDIIDISEDEFDQMYLSLYCSWIEDRVELIKLFKKIKDTPSLLHLPRIRNIYIEVWTQARYSPFKKDSTDMRDIMHIASPMPEKQRGRIKLRNMKDPRLGLGYELASRLTNHLSKKCKGIISDIDDNLTSKDDFNKFVKQGEKGYVYREFKKKCTDLRLFWMGPREIRSLIFSPIKSYLDPEIKSATNSSPDVLRRHIRENKTID